MRPQRNLADVLLILGLLTVTTAVAAQSLQRHFLQIQGGFTHTHVFGNRYLPPDTLPAAITTPADDHFFRQNSHGGQAGVLYTIENPFSTNQYFVTGIQWFQRTNWKSIALDSLEFYNYNGFVNNPYEIRWRFHAVEVPVLAGIRWKKLHAEIGIKLIPVVFKSRKSFHPDGTIERRPTQFSREGLGSYPVGFLSYQLEIRGIPISPYLSAERRGYDPAPVFWDFSAGIRLQIWSK